MYTSPLGANKERTDHGMRTIQLESVEKIAIKIRPKVEHEDITTCGRVMTNMSNQLLQEKQFNRMSLCFFLHSLKVLLHCITPPTLIDGGIKR